MYDFGQLNSTTEKDYTRQIVKGRCKNIENVHNRLDIIEDVSHVLAWSQAYMRDRKVLSCLNKINQSLYDSIFPYNKG